jgi:hypothetical protein
MTSRFELIAFLAGAVSSVGAFAPTVAATAGPDDGGGSMVGGLVAAVFLVLIVSGAILGFSRAVRRSRDRS